MKKFFLLLCTFLLFCVPAQASDPPDLFDEACARFGVPKDLVLAIAKTESDLEPWVVNVAGKDFRAKSREQALGIIHAAKARGLSHDIGIMQINDWWLRHLGIAPETALEPRNNALLGVWILAKEIRRHGFSWRAVGAYHSPTPWRQQQYALRVSRHYQKLKGASQ